MQRTQNDHSKKRATEIHPSIKILEIKDFQDFCIWSINFF